MLRTFAAIAVAVVIAGIGAQLYLSWRGPDDAFANCRGGETGGDIGGPFTLVDSSGKTVTDTDVITEPSLIYFGYTFCPDVCPLDNARNADAVDVLAEKGYAVTPVFISIDPARDTPQVMDDFAANMHEKMIGLTGSPEQVKAASTAYRTYYSAHDAGDEFYLVDHSTFTYLVFPEIGFVDYFRRDVTADEMAERTACFIDAAGN